MNPFSTPISLFVFSWRLESAGRWNLSRACGWTEEFELNILNNFGQLLLSDSQLPHVRTDFPLYYHEGKNGISHLETSYTTEIAPDVYAKAKAGLLEDMFAGAGGEVLWRPEGERWAVGASLFEVWQREFDRLFDLQPYHVLTGHLNLYYESPYYGLNFAVNAGRYLAGDYGATLQVTRRFSTGVEVGIFATLTNVPFSKFGEGSFDKGFIIRIPLDWALPLDSQTEYDTVLRPVTRDGGQMLDGEQTLYEDTRRTSFSEILANDEKIVNP